jgi:hypothetical protein
VAALQQAHAEVKQFLKDNSKESDHG